MTQVTKATVHRAVVAALSMVVLVGLGVVSSRAAELGSGGLDVLHVRKNVYMIAGDGANIGVQVGIDGVVLVNAGTAAGTDRLLAAVKKISPLPIRYIIDTDADAESVGGNAAVAAAGKTLFHAPIGPGASILAHDNVLAQMAHDGSPPNAWPTEAYLSNRTTLYINHEPVLVFNQPAAHSSGDSFVLFRSSDVVYAGNVLDMTRFPVIDVAHGGSVQGEIDALNNLLQLAVGPQPLLFEYHGTDVIPGHGRLCDQDAVVDYRDMMVILRDTIASMMKRHMTLAQIEAAHPAEAYEPRFGSTAGPWTTNMFVDAIYKSLAPKKAKKVNKSDEG